VVVAGLVPQMRQRGLKIMGHGATGRGNDQVRFQLAAQMLDPQIRVYAPWRDPAFLRAFGGRREMIDYCQRHHLPIKATHDKPYSTDANLLGLTHEAGQLESLCTPAQRIAPGMGAFPQKAPDRPERFSVRFEGGMPVRINGQPVSPLEALQQSNAIAGRHGVGIGLHTVENRFVGIKSRGVYEAPGMELLGQCYEYLLQLVLDRRARRAYAPISAYIAEQVYQGYWFDTATQACWKFVEHLSGLATGTIEVSLYKGNVSFGAAADVPHSLYREDTASMEAVGDFDHQDSEGFLGVLGVSARVLNRAGQIRG
jgi:argininosuccinate synthase